MKCQKCNQNNASVFYREIINGSERSIALCSSCAEKENISSPDPFFLSLFGVDSAKRSVRSASDEKKCDLCGMTFAHFTRTGKAGCERCYRTFENELKKPLFELHGGKTHIGRRPRRVSADNAGASEQNIKPTAATTKCSELERLKDELTEAIKCENFEKAAELRDAIRDLQGKEGQA